MIGCGWLTPTQSPMFHQDVELGLGFDQAALASEAARCMLRIGDLAEARRQAESIIELRPSERIWSRALAQIALATVLIGQRRPDEACATAQRALDATRFLSSVLVARQLARLTDLLRPYRANQVVSEFLVQLAQALAERTLIHRWSMTPGGREES